MLAEENKALVRRFYEEIDKGNLDAMDELVAEDYLDHSPPPFPGLASGREGLKQAFKIFWTATPGYHYIEDQIAEGDKVVTRLTAGVCYKPSPCSRAEVHRPSGGYHPGGSARLGCKADGA